MDSPSARSSWTKLREAVSNDDVLVVKRLLDEGADANAADDTGTTALHVAVDKGHEAVVEYLLAEGADVNAASKSGWTALHHAADKGYEAIVEQLLGAGATSEARNRHGKSALDLASQRGHGRLAERLGDTNAPSVAQSGRPSKTTRAAGRPVEGQPSDVFGINAGFTGAVGIGILRPVVVLGAIVLMLGSGYFELSESGPIIVFVLVAWAIWEGFSTSRVGGFKVSVSENSIRVADTVKSWSEISSAVIKPAVGMDPHIVLYCSDGEMLQIPAALQNADYLASVIERHVADVDRQE